MLNPAPSRKTEQEVIEAVSFLTPNEHEASLLFDEMTVQEAIRKYPGKLFVTQGKQGVLYFDGKPSLLIRLMQSIQQEREIRLMPHLP
jgi:ribokinase